MDERTVVFGLSASQRIHASAAVSYREAELRDRILAAGEWANNAGGRDPAGYRRYRSQLRSAQDGLSTCYLVRRDLDNGADELAYEWPTWEVNFLVSALDCVRRACDPGSVSHTAYTSLRRLLVGCKRTQLAA